jgi:hypothetical protein
MGQAVPTRSLNQKPYHLSEFRFSDSKVRPDPVFGPPILRASGDMQGAYIG